MQRRRVERAEGAEGALAEAAQQIGVARASIADRLRARVLERGGGKARQRRQRAHLRRRQVVDRAEAEPEHTDEAAAVAHRQAERGVNAAGARARGRFDAIEHRVVERDHAMVDAGEEAIDERHRQMQRRRARMLAPAQEHRARVVAQVHGAVDAGAGDFARQLEEARERGVHVAQRREDLRHLLQYRDLDHRDSLYCARDPPAHPRGDRGNGGVRRRSGEAPLAVERRYADAFAGLRRELVHGFRRAAFLVETKVGLLQVQRLPPSRDRRARRRFYRRARRTPRPPASAARSARGAHTR